MMMMSSDDIPCKEFQGYNNVTPRVNYCTISPDDITSEELEKYCCFQK